MPAPETTPEDIKSAALRLGWSLSDDEAAKVAHGVRRNQRWNDELRAYVELDAEPATTFAARPER